MASKKFRWNAIAVAWLSWTESVSVWTLARTYSSSSPLNSQSWENTFRSHGMHAIKRLSLSKWPTTATTSTIPNAQWLERGWLFLIFKTFLMTISLKMAHYSKHHHYSQCTVVGKGLFINLAFGITKLRWNIIDLLEIKIVSNKAK